jgi:hypothetical protein
MDAEDGIPVLLMFAAGHLLAQGAKTGVAVTGTRTHSQRLSSKAGL